jgi:hypothetical protein
MNLQFTDEQFKEVVGKALLDAMDQSKKDALIKDALVYLITPKGNGYNPTSPLQESFRSAVYTVATRILEEKLTQDSDALKQISQCVDLAFKKVTQENRDELINNLARAIAEAFKVKDRY